MEFRVLGPVEAWNGGTRVPLGGPKQRLVLAHLLIRADRIVPAESLIEEIWGEQPPDAARSALRAYVSRLRKALGEARLEGHPPGYVLHAAPEEVDSVRFESLVHRARDGVGRDPGAAADLLDGAFRLWRGAPFADLADEPSLRPEVARLEGLHLGAREDQIEAALASTGQVDVGELERLTRDYPLRERFWGHLMLVLYRSGRQAEALEAYQRVQKMLAEELGINPSPDLQRLHQKILRQDPGLDLRGEPLRGYRLIEQIGRGPWGTVHRAFHPETGREVAVKSVRVDLADDPRFIRGFESGTQLVARLEHPHVVPLYDYWREPGGAYLVMRYLRGGNLREALKKGPISGESALSIVEQVSGALEAAHRDGVVHGNVKPENILFDGEGNAYLTDFGVAGGLPASGAAGHAPSTSTVYAPPEQISGGPATPTTDIYSLGLVLCEILTGRPFPEEPGVSGEAKLPHLPRAVGDVIATATADAPEERYADAPALVLALRAALGAASASHAIAVEARNPYKGLRPFLESDAPDFFGREALTEQLVRALADTDSRFLAVVGPSGSGKSSLVRAGLVPALRRGAFPGSERCFVVDMLPGSHPFEELAAALLRIAVNPPANLLEQLERDESGLLRAVRRALPPGDSELLLVIDQFEELFTLVEDEARRAAFLASLVAAVSDPRSRTRVLVTLRADFYDKPLEYKDFADLVAGRTIVVPPPSTEELERAICGPANAVGVGLEPSALAEILTDVTGQPGALPLLQYALTELFAERQDSALTLDAYQRIGRVSGAIAQRAEALYEQQGPKSKEAVRQLFLRLITVGEDGAEDTRRRVSRSELASLEVDRTAMEAVIDAYGARRLLSFDRDPLTRSPTVEVAHEALLREWTRLRGWIDAARQGVRMHRRLNAAAADWQPSGEDPSFLLRGGRLSQFESWAQTTDLALTDLERRYVGSSVAQREAEVEQEQVRRDREATLERRSLVRLQAMIAVLTIAAVAASILSFVAVGQRGRAQRETRVATARELSSAATSNLEVDPELSILLALQAVAATRQDGTVLPEATEALHAALAADRQILTLRDPSTANVAWSPDGRLIATGGSAGGKDQDNVVLWDARTGARLLTLKGHTGDIGFVAFSPDSSRLVTTAQDNRVMVWNTRTGKRLLTMNESGLAQGATTFSPDGTRLVFAEDNPANTAATLKVLDATTGRGLLSARLDEGTCNPPVYSPDGTRIAVPGTRDVAILDSRTEALVVRVPSSGNCALAYSPDGRELATATPLSPIGNIASVWDARTGRRIESLAGHTGSILSVAWSADGSRIATGSTDGTVRVWDAPTGQQALSLSCGGGLAGGVAFSPDGARLVVGCGDGMARVFDISPAGTAEAFGVSGPSGLTSVAYSSDGSRLVTTGLGTRPVQGAWLWDATTGQRLEGYPGVWYETAFGGDGSTIATLGDTVAIMSTSSGRVVRTLDTGGRSFDAVAYASDGSMAAAAGVDGTAALWEAASGDKVRSFGRPSGTDSLVDVGFSPNGELLAGISALATLHVWDVSTGRELFHEQASTGLARGLAFAPDGTRLVTSGGDGATVWAIPSRKRIARLTGAGSIGTVAFSPDGKLVATGGDDGAARIWDAATGQRLLTLTGHTNGLTGVAFNSSGTRLATASLDGTLRVYVLPVDQLVRLARARLTRGFTDPECLQYLHVPMCPSSLGRTPLRGSREVASSRRLVPLGPEGAFRVTISPQDLRGSGVPKSEWRQFLGDDTLSLQAGSWQLHSESPGGSSSERSGTYTASARRITFVTLNETTCFGGRWSAKWSLGVSGLRFTDITSRVPQACGPRNFQTATKALFGSRPLTRVT